MTDLYIGLRRHTTTSQTFWAVDNDNTGGVLGVIVDGNNAFSGETMGAANDYTAVVDATGLSSGSHSYELTVDGNPTGITGTFKTAPGSNEPVKLLFTGDCQPIDGAFGNLIRNEAEVDAFFCYEYKYIDGGEYTAPPCNATTPFTIANPTGATGSDPENNADFKAFRASYRIKHRCSLTQESARYLYSTMVPHYLVWNNHEYISTIPTPDPGQNHFDGAYQAALEYYFNGNPLNTDADLDSVPSRITYFAHQLGPVEIICDDITTYSQGALDAALSGSGYTPSRGEGKQLAWIKKRIDDCTADWLVIFHQSALPDAAKTFAWPEWTDATDGILKHIADRTDLTVVILTTNNHRPFARLVTYNKGSTDGVFEASCNPLTQYNPSSKGTISGDVLYWDDGHATLEEEGYADPGNCNWIYATVEADSERLTLKVKNALTSEVRMEAVFNKGDRIPSFVTTDTMYSPDIESVL